LFFLCGRAGRAIARAPIGAVRLSLQYTIGRKKASGEWTV
jgi:hypothetical protein